MGNLKEKRNKIALIEEIIDSEMFGLVDVAKEITFVMTEISRIKKALFDKSKSKIGYEKEMYYKMAIKTNINNYMDYFKILDSHILKKSKNIGKPNNSKQPDKYELAPRKTAEIEIGQRDIPNFLKGRLKQFVYLQTSRPNSISIYLRNRKDYENNLSELKAIKGFLDTYKFNCKIYIIGSSKIIEDMSGVEKREFVEFLSSY